METKELTHGNPLKIIFHFMLPIFFGNIFQQIYNFADALIVGRVLGISSLGAVGATAPLVFLAFSFIFATTQGFSVVTAQKFGANDEKNVKKSVTTSLFLSILMTVILTLFTAPFTYKMLVFLRTPDDILYEAYEYLLIIFLGIFSTVFYNISSNIIRALGDSKTPFYILIFASILNIFLDLFLIVKFNMGVSGAALATVISQVVASVFCFMFMFFKFPILKLKKEDWKLDKDFIYEHLRIGIPMGFQMSILTIGIIALQFVLNGLGSIAVASYTTAMRVDQIFSQIYLALGVTMATYTAQNFGAKKMGRIKDGAKASIFIAFIASVIAIIILSLFSKQIVALFMDKPNIEVINLASQYLYIVMIFFFFLGVLIIYRNILQGMGKVVAPLMSGVAELIARTVSAFILGEYFGYLGICYSTPLAWVMAAIVLYVGYKISLIKSLKNLRMRKKAI